MAERAEEDWYHVQGEGYEGVDNESWQGCDGGSRKREHTEIQGATS